MQTDEQLWHWRRACGRPWPGVHVFAALAEAFLAGIETDDPPQAAGGPVLYLANHQTYLESALFGFAVPALTGRPVIALAKLEHRERWLGRIDALVSGHPAARSLRALEYFDTDNPGSLGDVVGRLRRCFDSGASILVHAEGTRHRCASRGRVRAVSPVWAALAVEHGWTIVPVRFIGGLPVEDQGTKHDLPVGHGAQTIRIGRAIPPAGLAELSPAEQAAWLRAAINALQDPAREQPGPPDADLAGRAEAWAALSGAEPAGAATLCALERYLGAHGPLAGTSRLADLVATAEAHRVAPAAFEVPAGDDQAWWVELARFVYGPRGPAVVIRRPVPRPLDACSP